MTKTGHVNVSADCALNNSLNAIRQAHIQLHLLADMGTSPALIASRIQLCDVLLVEIAGIRGSLARNLKQGRGGQAFSHLEMNS